MNDYDDEDTVYKNPLISNIKISKINSSISTLNIVDKFEENIFNKYKDKLLFYQQLTDELEYKKVKSKKGNGQLKLFLGEIFFLNQIINDQDFINLVNSNTQVILLYIG